MPVDLVVNLVVRLAFGIAHDQARKQLSVGIVKDSGGIGLGKFVTEGPGVLKFRNKFAI